MIKLSDELGKMFAEAMGKVIQKEIDEPEYLAQSQFEDSETPCLDRAQAMIDDALEQPLYTLGLAIADNAIEKYDIDTDEEVKTFEAALTPKNIEVALRGWWNA